MTTFIIVVFGLLLALVSLVSLAGTVIAIIDCRYGASPEESKMIGFGLTLFIAFGFMAYITLSVAGSY